MASSDHVPGDLEDSLFSSITSRDIQALTADIGETFVDQLLSNGPIRDLPIVRTLFDVYRTVVNIGDYCFLRKVIQFLFHLKDVPLDKRQAFDRSMRNEPKTRKRVGANLILTLHRLDAFEKADLLGRVFRAYVEGSTDQDTFLRLATAIDRLDVNAIPALQRFYGSHAMLSQLCQDDDLQSLAICGLVAIRLMPGMVFGAGGGYEQNELGRTFLRLALSSPV